MSVFRFLTGLLIAAFLAAAYYVFSGEPAPAATIPFEARSDPGNPEIVVFSWEGPIDPPVAREMSRAFKKWRADVNRIRIELDSPGGSVDEGDRIVSLIRKMKKTHSVWTYVGDDADCLSMCVPIYLQGDMRVAGANSRWLFHDAGAVDPYTGTEIVMYAHERNRANFNFINRYIDRSDIDPEWRETLKRKLKTGEVWKTGQELKDERSNIVMVLE